MPNLPAPDPGYTTLLLLTTQNSSCVGRARPTRAWRADSSVHAVLLRRGTASQVSSIRTRVRRPPSAPRTRYDDCHARSRRAAARLRVGRRASLSNEIMILMHRACINSIRCTIQFRYDRAKYGLCIHRRGGPNDARTRAHPRPSPRARQMTDASQPGAVGASLRHWRVAVESSEPPPSPKISK